MQTIELIELKDLKDLKIGKFQDDTDLRIFIMQIYID